jgi:hypothetical protein
LAQSWSAPAYARSGCRSGQYGMYGGTYIVSCAQLEPPESLAPWSVCRFTADARQSRTVSTKVLENAEALSHISLPGACAVAEKDVARPLILLGLAALLNTRYSNQFNRINCFVQPDRSRKVGHMPQISSARGQDPVFFQVFQMLHPNKTASYNDVFLFHRLSI